MTIEQLTNFFVNEEKWIKDKIIKISKTSNFKIVRHNSNDALELFSELWIILSAQKTLDKMRNETDLRGKINNTLYLLLNKSGSKFIRSVLTTESAKSYINYIKMDVEIEVDNDNDLIENELKKIDEAHIRFKNECDKVDSIIYNLYFIKDINTLLKFSKHLNISIYSAKQVIDELTIVLKNMAKNGSSYALEKEEYKKMKKVLKNKFGIFEVVEDDCNCGCKDCKEPITEPVVESIMEDILIDESSDLIDEDIDSDD